ncbi:MAG: zinc-dependent peptidase [Bacteroidia bacterium]
MATLNLLFIIFVWAYVRYFHLVKDDGFYENYEMDNSYFFEYNQFYKNHIPYYNSLDDNNKNKFIARSVFFSSKIEIQTREDLVYTNEMDLFICGCIAQLTFGFNKPNLSLLKGVILFPDIFYSRLVESNVKGLAMGNGVVFLSWYHFKEGYQDSRDTYNLGLHEFAHILRIDATNNEVKDNKFSNFYEEWNEQACIAFNNMRNGSIDFFREYASTNEAEFFSVCIENFFEVPDLFEKELPALYYHLCYLLNQNPLNTLENYSFDREDIETANSEIKQEIPMYEYIFSKTEKKFWEFGHQIIFVFLFFISIYSLENINIPKMLHIFATFMLSILIMLTVRYKFYNDIRCITNTDYLSHVFVKIMPLIIVLSFMVNTFFI